MDFATIHSKGFTGNLFKHNSSFCPGVAFPALERANFSEQTSSPKDSFAEARGRWIAQKNGGFSARFSRKKYDSSQTIADFDFLLLDFPFLATAGVDHVVMILGRHLLFFCSPRNLGGSKKGVGRPIRFPWSQSHKFWGRFLAPTQGKDG